MNQDLKEILNAEKSLYIPHIKTLKNKIMAIYTHNEEYEIFRFICALRKAEFYKTKSKLIFTYYLRKSNIRGNRLGYFIAPGTLGKGVRLYHRGGIIINSNSKIGDGCLFHGDNCVGNNGMNNSCPVLGKNVELGIGAVPFLLPKKPPLLVGFCNVFLHFRFGNFKTEFPDSLSDAVQVIISLSKLFQILTFRHSFSFSPREAAASMLSSCPVHVFFCICKSQK